MKPQKDMSADAKEAQYKKFITLVSKLVERNDTWDYTSYSPTDVAKFTKIKSKAKDSSIVMGDPKQYYVTVNYGTNTITSYGINENVNEYIFGRAIEQAAKTYGIKLSKHGTEFYLKWKIID